MKKEITETSNTVDISKSVANKYIYPVTHTYRTIVSELIEFSKNKDLRKEYIKIYDQIKKWSLSSNLDNNDMLSNSEVIKELLNIKWFSLTELNLLKQYIFTQNFIEWRHFLTSLRDFINSAFSYLDMISYKYIKDKELLEFYWWNKELDMTRIYLDDILEWYSDNDTSYINEIKAVSDTSWQIHCDYTNSDNWWWVMSYKISLPWWEELIVSIKTKETLYEYDKAILKDQVNRLKLLFESTLLNDTSNLLLSNIKARYKDDLTGLYNKEYLHTITKTKKFSVINIDIDNFKSLNDTYGHQAWDEVLITVSNLLKRVTKSNDRVCRVGWDEFVVLISTNNKNELDTVIWRINQEWSESLTFNFIDKNIECNNNCKKCTNYNIPCNNRVNIGLSIWWVVMDKRKSITEMMFEADKDMYDKKTDGWKMYRVLNQINTINDYSILQEIYTELFWRMLEKWWEDKLLWSDFKNIFKERIELISDIEVLNQLNEVLTNRIKSIT